MEHRADESEARQTRHAALRAPIQPPQLLQDKIVAFPQILKTGHRQTRFLVHSGKNAIHEIAALFHHLHITHPRHAHRSKTTEPNALLPHHVHDVAQLVALSHRILLCSSLAPHTSTWLQLQQRVQPLQREAIHEHELHALQMTPRLHDDREEHLSHVVVHGFDGGLDLPTTRESTAYVGLLLLGEGGNVAECAVDVGPLLLRQ